MVKAIRLRSKIRVKLSWGQNHAKSVELKFESSRSELKVELSHPELKGLEELT